MYVQFDLQRLSPKWSILCRAEH